MMRGNWLATADGYEGKLVCRNKAGRTLGSVPAAARCRDDVERLMVRSLPVPVGMLALVWADEAWRTALTDLVVAALDDRDRWDPAEVGFLRDAGDDGLGVVGLDGETLRLVADRIAIPHPVLLAELDELREFAADLEVRQSVDQLFRETWIRPAGLDATLTGVRDYAGGRYEQLRHLLARATSLGYPVRGGYAVCRVFEGGRAVDALSWLGAEDLSYEAETGELAFTDGGGTARRLGEVGPVAWSEGMRMAAGLYAGRVVAEGEMA